MHPSHRIQVNKSVRAIVRFAFVIWTFVTCITTTGSSATIVGKAETSRSHREQAIREIPFKGLTPEAQKRIAAVVSKPSMFRRMPITVIDCDPTLHRFLLRNPEVVVNIWQLMGITKVSANRTGPYSLSTSDGVGTTSSVELIYGTKDTHLYFCEGQYEGPLFRKPVNGRCVILLKTGHREKQSGKWSLSNRMDIYLQLDHVGIDAITKTLHPLLGRSADVNFSETMKFVERISATAEKNGPGMERLAERLDNVQQSTREEFTEHTTNIFEKSQVLAIRKKNQEQR